MKKLIRPAICIALALSLLLVLASCGGFGPQTVEDVIAKFNYTDYTLISDSVTLESVQISLENAYSIKFSGDLVAAASFYVQDGDSGFYYGGILLQFEQAGDAELLQNSLRDTAGSEGIETTRREGKLVYCGDYELVDVIFGNASSPSSSSSSSPSSSPSSAPSQSKDIFEGPFEILEEILEEIPDIFEGFFELIEEIFEEIFDF